MSELHGLTFDCVSNAHLRRYLYKSTQYYGASSHLRAENFPPNRTTAGLAEGLAEGHKAYGILK